MLQLRIDISPRRFWSAFNLFTNRQQKKLIILGFIQVMLSFIDLIAVAALTLLGSITVTGIQSRQATGTTFTILQWLRIENFEVQQQALILGTFALSLMLTRSILSILIVRMSLKAISIASSEISASLISKVFGTKRLKKLGLEPQEVLYCLTQGITMSTIGIVGTFVTIIGDIGLAVLMFIAILVANPSIALTSLVIFGSASLILSKLLHASAIRLGSSTANLNIESNRLIMETVEHHEELYVRNRIDVFAGRISELRRKLMETNRQLVFLPNLSKYVFETAILLSAFFLAALQFYKSDAPTAIASLTLFLASASRIVPALLRIQQGLMSIKTNIAASESTLNLVAMLSKIESLKPEFQPLQKQHQGFSPQVEILNGNFTYPLGSSFGVRNINLRILPGELVAIVGKSGAGKSTLIDLILGILEFDSGEIQISGHKPQIAVSKWPGAIAFVPQDVKLIECSLRENILLGFSSEEIPDSSLEQVLSLLQLDQLFSKNQGLDTWISQFGIGLSGGQIQRIGIARALISNPRLLILDEPTSALDAETENVIINLLGSMRGNVSVVVIAHRLSTVKHADRLYWMENGEIVSSGTFDNLRQLNKDFDASVTLLGL